ncbi:hypothetical protein TRFO_18612 [Tritrichomonas foetus]|uniref:Uncharacterized protein n=1 Tax=Tritrichomonas foetus TaxID=1144522 RepID=A0A1J4KQS8_9EUKA|nr:hypothetical protein TRFO_18612 [Tritrichomonas foetus]|eukprot:OHT11821.1 hypothetical protein TRFO_18612 [Tritrichomonas foetus]
MSKTYCANTNLLLKVNVGPEIMNKKIITVTPVIRPLDIASTHNKLGRVLSHSGVLLKTNREYLMVEYMSENKVLVNKVGSLKKDKDTFLYHTYNWCRDKYPPQKPKDDITVKEFAEKMADFMKNKNFDTFCHNCHHARYLTMKHYGMKTDDPFNNKRNVLFQGFVDYFRYYK